MPQHGPPGNPHMGYPPSQKDSDPVHQFLADLLGVPATPTLGGDAPIVHGQGNTAYPQVGRHPNQQDKGMGAALGRIADIPFPPVARTDFNAEGVAPAADSDTTMDLLGDRSNIQVSELPPIANPVEEVLAAAPLPVAAPMINIGQEDDVSIPQAQQDLSLRAMIEHNAANTPLGRTEVASPLTPPGDVYESDARTDPQVQALVDQDEALAVKGGLDSESINIQEPTYTPIQNFLPAPTPDFADDYSMIPPAGPSQAPPPEPASPQIEPQAPVAPPPPSPPQAPRQDVIINEANRILDDNPQLFGMQGDELAFALQDLGVDRDVLLYIHELVTDQFESVDIGDNIQ